MASQRESIGGAENESSIRMDCVVLTATEIVSERQPGIDATTDELPAVLPPTRSVAKLSFNASSCTTLESPTLQRTERTGTDDPSERRLSRLSKVVSPKEID